MFYRVLTIVLTVLLGQIKTKREVDQRWKSGQIPTGNDKAVATRFKDADGIAKAQLKLKLTRNVKASKKWFFRYIESKWKQGKYWHTVIWEE